MGTTSVQEALVKHLSTLLRESKATIMVLLSDENGLSIAKVARGSDIDLDPNAITSVSAAAYSASEETWGDLGIKDQAIAFSFFEKICLITIRINQTLLTIVHDFNLQWPLNADTLGSVVFYLKQEIENFFGKDQFATESLEAFSNKVRSAAYLFSMGTEIDFVSYRPQDSSAEVINQIGAILDSVQNPVFTRYALVNPSGLTLDAREVTGQGLPATVEAFSANSNVAFQKMVEEAEGMNVGNLLAYVCISGPDGDNLHGILACPCGKLMFSDPSSEVNSVEEISFVALFPMVYGAIPVMGEARNIVYSILEVIGSDPHAEAFINCVNTMNATKIQ
ncbi:MAG: hypothetical protein ACTSU5_18095 [Promethearchaeota archaeon]